MIWPTHAEIEESVAFLEPCASRWEAGEEYLWIITMTPEARNVL